MTYILFELFVIITLTLQKEMGGSAVKKIRTKGKMYEEKTLENFTCNHTGEVVTRSHHRHAAVIHHWFIIHRHALPIRPRRRHHSGGYRCQTSPGAHHVGGYGCWRFGLRHRTTGGYPKKGECPSGLCLHRVRSPADHIPRWRSSISPLNYRRLRINRNNPSSLVFTTLSEKNSNFLLFRGPWY